MKKITIIRGKIASGKTQIGIEKSIECLNSGKSVVYFNFEDKKEKIMKWFVAKSLCKHIDEVTKDDILKVKENTLFSNFFLIENGIEKIKNYGLFYFVDLVVSSDVIIIDFLQCMGRSKETYNSIINFAKKYDKEIYIVVSDNNNEFTVNDADEYDEIYDTESYFTNNKIRN